MDLTLQWNGSPQSTRKVHNEQNFYAGKKKKKRQTHTHTHTSKFCIKLRDASQLCLQSKLLSLRQQILEDDIIDLRVYQLSLREIITGNYDASKILRFPLICIVVFRDRKHTSSQCSAQGLAVLQAHE